MSNNSNSNRNTGIRSNKISDTSRKGTHRHNADTIDPNRLRELKNMTRPSQRSAEEFNETEATNYKELHKKTKTKRNFSPNTVGYIDPEEFEKAYSKEIEELHQHDDSGNTRRREKNTRHSSDGTPRTRGEPLKNPRTGETLSTGRTSTRSGKGTGLLNDSKLGKWLIAAITAIIIIGLTWFYVQNDEARNGLKNSLTGNTTNSAESEVTHNIGDNDYAPKGPTNDSEDFEGAGNINGNGDNLINDGTQTNSNNIIDANADGTVGSSRSGYYDEYGNFVTNDTIHDGDGRAFDADSLATRISSALSSESNSNGNLASNGDLNTNGDLDSADYVYIIGQHDGKLAIFLDGNSEPLEVYDTYVSDLPEADRNYIKKGIRVTSVADLAAYLEDLTS